MQSFALLLAWLYWNPSRIAFTIPIIERPVAWYGCLFVLGFLLGYFIVIPVIKKFIVSSKHLSSLDIASWPLLINYLQAASPQHTPLTYKILSKLDAQTRQQLSKLKVDEPIPETIKDSILHTLNYFLENETIQRNEIEKSFPLCFHSLNHVCHFLADRLCWFMVAGTLIGARLGAVFFYDWDLYASHPIEIFKVWKGGLASHGGVIGILIALYCYLRYVQKWLPSLSFIALLDFVCVPIPLAAFFIRIGNFINQEISGTPSTLPWAVVFGDPLDVGEIVPRHPVQLYEGLAYLGIFILLYTLWRKKHDLRKGVISGLFLILIFSSRFILEFWKATQTSSILEETSILQMGQLLSIPCILGGIYLFYSSNKRLYPHAYPVIRENSI